MVPGTPRTPPGAAAADPVRAAVAAPPRPDERWLVATLLFAILLLRLLYLGHFRIDSDEPQHLHVAWAWANGLLPYRDVFDNHAPLFHVLCAPLVRLLGERPDVIPLVRSAMLPTWGGVVVATGLVAAALASARVGWWTMPVAALAPAYFLKSVEFRTDDLWAAVFLIALAVAVRGSLSRRRAFAAGLLVGVALAVSMKTTLLVAACAFAAIATTAVRGGGAHAWRVLARAAGAALVGALVAPALVVGWFALRGATAPLLYGTVWHNTLPDLGLWHRAPWRAVVVPLALPPLVAAAWWLVAHADDRRIGARRAFVLLAGCGYVALVAGAWPVVTTEDWLPVAPLAALVGVAAVLELPPGRLRDARAAIARRLSARAALLVVVALEAALAVHGASPLVDRTEPERQLLAAVLRLTTPGEPVMDVKGETVFRPRPFYWGLEYVTNERLRRGLIPDDIPERLVATRTAVIVPDTGRFPHRGRAFMDAYYVSVGDVRVLGRWLVPPGAPTPSAPIDFDVAFADRFSIVAPTGEAHGRLDGAPYTGARTLAPGRHELAPDPGSGPLALVWTRAVERGFAPVAEDGHG